MLKVRTRQSKKNTDVRRAAAGILVILVVSGVCGCGDDGPPALNANTENALAIRSEFKSAAGGVGGGPASALSPPIGWANLTGQFVIEGPVPSPGIIVPDKAGCGTSIVSDAIVVDPATKGLKNVLLFMHTSLPQDDSGSENPVWVHADYNLQNNPEKVFDQDDCMFLDRVFPVRSEQVIVLKNSDTVGHNVKIDARQAAKYDLTIASGNSDTHVLGREEREPFMVSCSIHSWMTAWMISRDNPYFKVSETDGRFDIENIPAGNELEFSIWHEKLGFAAPGVLASLTVNGEDRLADLRRGRLKINFEADKTYDLQVVVNAAALSN